VRTKPVHDIAQGFAASLSSSFEIAIFCAPLLVADLRRSPQKGCKRRANNE
jgi:hypothetical protein